MDIRKQLEDQTMVNDRNGNPPRTGPEPGVLELSEQDLKHVRSYEEKTQVLRDRTVQAARNMSPGLFVFGSGGVGKSYVVKQTLEAEGASWKLAAPRKRR